MSFPPLKQPRFAQRLAQADPKLSPPATPRRNTKKSTPAAPPPADEARWQAMFESGNVKPQVLRRLVTELSAEKKTADVIVILELALIHGHGEPWMYEVLALSMELAGRPRPQIERVLLSARDLTPPDAESLLFLAAYLARFERFDRAIHCCRQAADLQPNRPEPYVTALRFAERAKDDDARAWAAIGVLNTAWGPKQQPLRDAAQLAVDEIREQWRAQGRLLELAAFETAVQQAARVDLRIRVDWSGTGDLDLEVLEPQGSLCSRAHPYSTGGGMYLHDGSGPNPQNCFDEYACPIAWSGEYRVRVVHSWGGISGNRAQLTVTRTSPNGQVDTDKIPLTILPEGNEVRVRLRDGRRREAAAPRQQPVRSAAPRPKTSILAQLQPGTVPVVPGAAAVGNIGYQPVIQDLFEGVSLGAMATVSGDRRYVRLNMNPFFNNVTDIFTFSFQR